MVKKRHCYPSDRVCVVLCVSSIVSTSCESSGSSSWPLHQRWQGVAPTRRADVQPARSFRDVRLFVREAVSVRVCFIYGPPAFTSSCLRDLLQPSAFLSGYSEWSIRQPSPKRASSYCMCSAYASAPTRSVQVYPPQ